MDEFSELLLKREQSHSYAATSAGAGQKDKGSIDREQWSL